MQATETKSSTFRRHLLLVKKKRLQEVRPYSRIVDSFTQIVIVKDNIIPWRDENGILYVGIEKFLLDSTVASHCADGI